MGHIPCLLKMSSINWTVILYKLAKTNTWYSSSCKVKHFEVPISSGHCWSLSLLSDKENRLNTSSSFSEYSLLSEYSGSSKLLGTLDVFSSSPETRTYITNTNSTNKIFVVTNSDCKTWAAFLLAVFLILDIIILYIYKVLTLLEIY